MLHQSHQGVTADAEPLKNNMHTSFIALGSNLSQPRKQIELAIKAISAIPDTTLIASSPWYQSKAVGPGDQPDYINGVTKITTRLSPLVLLRALQAIESSQRRRRSVRWAPRTLDLDILLYDDLICTTADLTLPHPRMRERLFVLFPLHDLAPELPLFRDTTIQRLLKQGDSEDLKKLAE